MFLWFCCHLSFAQEIYMSISPDGVMRFTDDPPPNEGYVLFNVNGPPPERKDMTLEKFPKMDLYDSYILEAAQLYMVSPALVKAVVMAESGMNVDALSKAGAQGLMQLMPATADGLGVSNVWDPKENIMGGTKYIRKNIDRFGNIERAVAAYNAGPGNVIKYKGIPPFEETQLYVERVMELYDFFLFERPITANQHADQQGSIEITLSNPVSGHANN